MLPTFRPVILAALAAVLLGATRLPAADSPAAENKTAETKAQRDARMQWWREARFGMFIHWGLYSVPAGTYHGKQIGGIGEWIMNCGEIPVAEYAGFAKQFNPVKFNADEWVSIAKNAGMKYIVITSKHHDGFAMFHSKASLYNIVDATPFGRDPLKELAAACKKQGIKLGFYYSQAQDWHHPGGFAYATNGRKQGHWDKAQDGDFHKYIREIAIPQVREILTNYGDVAVLWWDTPAGMTREEVHELAGLLKLQPKIIANNRLGNGIDGDTETPEQFIPATGYPGRDWETCMTMNDTWGYKSYDHNWKSTETLLRNLIDIASKGGNYLLNVGPTNEGLIPPASVERLQAGWPVAEGQRRGDLRHLGGTVQARPALGPGDPERRHALPARLRLAQGRQAPRAAGEQGDEGLLARGQGPNFVCVVRRARHHDPGPRRSPRQDRQRDRPGT